MALSQLDLTGGFNAKINLTPGPNHLRLSVIPTRSNSSASLENPSMILRMESPTGSVYVAHDLPLGIGTSLLTSCQRQALIGLIENHGNTADLLTEITYLFKDDSLTWLPAYRTPLLRLRPLDILIRLQIGDILTLSAMCIVCVCTLACLWIFHLTMLLVSVRWEVHVDTEFQDFHWRTQKMISAEVVVLFNLVWRCKTK
jgi:hypothetical protein